MERGGKIPSAQGAGLWGARRWVRRPRRAGEGIISGMEECYRNVQKRTVSIKVKKRIKRVARVYCAFHVCGDQPGGRRGSGGLMQLQSSYAARLSKHALFSAIVQCTYNGNLAHRLATLSPFHRSSSAAPPKYVPALCSTTFIHLPIPALNLNRAVVYVHTMLSICSLQHDLQYKKRTKNNIKTYPAHPSLQ